MKKLFLSQSLGLGLAMFSMFFGAGNIIFPLAVGQFAQDKNIFAVFGLIVTAAIMPIVGVMAMILFDGNYRAFFGRMGKTPGLILATLIISLLGPFGSTPRCIALSYATLKSSFADVSPIFFSISSCLIIFLFAVKKNSILTLLGWIFTPLLLVSLITIILVGLATPHVVDTVEQAKFPIFLYGLKEGYNTMDLLAAFFFSSTILNILQSRKNIYGGVKTALYASIVGASLLAIIYVGFSYLAVFHAHGLNTLAKEDLLAAIIIKIAGPFGATLVCVTVALACLTTAIALIAAFSDFIQREVFKEKARYEVVLLGSLFITCIISMFEFTGISAFLGPILQICYPGLIVLTLLNIAYRLKNFQPIKIPVFLVFCLSTLFYFVFI